MRVSAKSDYALRALIEIARRGDSGPVSAEELGRLQEIPHGFLQAILADMRRAGIVVSQRGRPAAVIVTAEAYEQMEQALAEVEAKQVREIVEAGIR